MEIVYLKFIENYVFFRMGIFKYGIMLGIYRNCEFYVFEWRDIVRCFGSFCGFCKLCCKRSYCVVFLFLEWFGDGVCNFVMLRWWN